MAELFGIKIPDMTVDFNGRFYKISVPTPFVEPSEEEAKR